MSKDYSAGKPVGNNGVPQYDSPPALKALVSVIRENGANSSVVSMTHNTTSLEIATGGNPALVRWIAASDTEGSVFGNASVMNFDHVIPANAVRRFVVPIEVVPTSSQSVQGINRLQGLFQRYAYRTQGGNSSVYSTEYGNSNSY